MDELASLDFSALQQINDDVLGWIRIPDSGIDFPLLQGEDNDYYLTHTWDHQVNSVGSIFLEHLNSPDFTDYNTIVYGHNMNDGAMFAGLKSFSDSEYRKNHPYIYIASQQGVYRYEIFSCYRAGLQDPTYGLSFNQQTTKEKFLAHALEKSVIQTHVQPAMTDRILTLSTCFGDGSNTRWVVHARLEMMPIEVPDL
jgi:sortase B